MPGSTDSPEAIDPVPPAHDHASEPPPVLRIEHASRQLGGRRVLDDVSLRLTAGRILALAGPNGAGKTTLMRAVAGRVRLDSGTIAINGLAPAEARRQGRLGIVPQELALYSHLTVRENLAVLGRLAGLPRSAVGTAVEAAMHWAGLSDRADAVVGTLSGGMRRRVNLVAGALHRPSLLLLDEPTVGMDSASETRLHALLRLLRGEGMAIVIATHDLEEAAVLCDDLAVVAEGRVTTAGSIADLVAIVFDGRRELRVTVDASSAGVAAAVLDPLGFRPTSPQTWMTPAPASLGALGEYEAQWRAAGLNVAEVRVSEPSLRGAIAMLTSTGGSGEA